MKLPLSWLADHVDLPDVSPAELAELMGRHGLEVDELLAPGSGVRGVTTARVLDWEPHPDADRLRVVRITHGDDEVELVCGAANFDVGDVVVHAPVGGSIPGMELDARELRGVVSNGMLCSAQELEVGDDRDGIMVLDEVEPGRDIHDLMPLGEPVFDLEVKGIRGDVLSVVGAARDLGAILDTPVRVPSPALPERSPGAVGQSVDVTIEAPEACQHFVALTLDDVAVPAVSPWWLRQRLTQVGVRSISPLVDITNWVMMELGQPMHAYDAEQLDGDLVVRWAGEDEHLTTLDDVDRALTPEDLVVADQSRAVGLAGVMGGEDTEVTETTSRLVLEAAVWDPATVRHTARTLRLSSEASLRFERGVDAAGARRAVARAHELLVEIGGSATVVGVAEAGAPVAARTPFTVSVDRINGLLGLELTGQQMVALLERAQVATEVDGDSLSVACPSWRRDLQRMPDVAEEVARLHGYEHIPAELPPLFRSGSRAPDQVAERDLRTAVAAFGLDEVVTRPFVGGDALPGMVPDDRSVLLANPLAQDAAAMRTSLFEGLLGVVRHNVGQSRPGVAVFEFGRVFRTAGGAMDDVLDGVTNDDAPGWRWRLPDETLLPTQPKVLGVALQGRRHGPGRLDDEPWSVQDALAVMDEVVRTLGATRDAVTLRRVPVERPGLHPYRTVSLQADEVEVGLVGQLHPSEAARRDLPDPVVVGELVVQPWLQAAMAGHDPIQATALVNRPALLVDVAIEAGDELGWDRLETAIRRAAGDLLVELRVFDVYRGDQLPEDHRSIAARLWLQDPGRQLTNDDEAAVLARIADAVAAIGARMRR